MAAQKRKRIGYVHSQRLGSTPMLVLRFDSDLAKCPGDDKRRPRKDQKDHKCRTGGVRYDYFVGGNFGRLVFELISLPCRHLPSSSDRCSFFLPPATPRYSQFGSTMRPLSPTLARLRLGHNPRQSWTNRTSCFHTHSVPFRRFLLSFYLSTSFPYPVPTSPSPIFNTC